MSSLLVFNRVYRLENSQSCWYFRHLLWTRTPLTFSLVHLAHLPPPCVNKYRGTCIQCIQCVTGGGDRGSQKINTCRKVPVLANFKEKPTFRVWCLYRYVVHGVITLFLKTCHLSEIYFLQFFDKMFTLRLYLYWFLWGSNWKKQIFIFRTLLTITWSRSKITVKLWYTVFK